MNDQTQAALQDKSQLDIDSDFDNKSYFEKELIRYRNRERESCWESFTSNLCMIISFILDSEKLINYEPKNLE